MGYGYALASIFAASLLAGAPSAALAQCRLCDSPTTGFEESSPGSAIQLQVETSLDFDRLVLLGVGEGEATLLPTGHRNSTGSIAALGAGAMVGSVSIRGEPGRAVTTGPGAACRRLADLGPPLLLLIFDADVERAEIDAVRAGRPLFCALKHSW